jgi:hypothetical protein
VVRGVPAAPPATTRGEIAHPAAARDAAAGERPATDGAHATPSDPAPADGSAPSPGGAVAGGGAPTPCDQPAAVMRQPGAATRSHAMTAAAAESADVVTRDARPG